MNARIPALDALRGVLAAVVVLHHVLLLFGLQYLDKAAQLAVISFFAMSGFVLARGYDGRPAAFLVKRLVRLWPLYSACVAVGYAYLGELPPISRLVWLPVPAYQGWSFVDFPLWSLYYEAWASPFLLLAFGRDRTVLLGLALASFALVLVQFSFVCVAPFVAGVAASRFKIRFPDRMPGWTMELGRISFSLYATHMLVLYWTAWFFGPWGAVASLPLVLAVAYLAWWTIERPSIKISRWIGTAPWLHMKLGIHGLAAADGNGLIMEQGRVGDRRCTTIALRGSLAFGACQDRFAVWFPQKFPSPTADQQPGSS